MAWPNHRGWFAQLWPFALRRRAVFGEYATLGTMPHLVADIALRGGVWRPLPVEPNAMQRAEGRRCLALELISLAGMTPEQLFKLVERKPDTGDSDNDALAGTVSFVEDPSRS